MDIHFVRSSYSLVHSIVAVWLLTRDNRQQKNVYMLNQCNNLFLFFFLQTRYKVLTSKWQALAKNPAVTAFLTVCETTKTKYFFIQYRWVFKSDCKRKNQMNILHYSPGYLSHMILSLCPISVQSFSTVP